MTPRGSRRPPWHLPRSLALLVLALLTSACAVSWLPQGDRALLQRIDELNRETLTLFAALETGVSAGSYSRFAPQYNALIGGFEAAKAQAEARAVPRLGLNLSENSMVQQVCGDKTAEQCFNETPAAMGRIAGDIREVRETHRARGLKPGDVMLYRDLFNTAIAGPLAIETALIR